MSNEVPERIFLRACHPANPNHNCTWSVSKESTQSVEYIRADLAAARIEQLEEKRLEDARQREAEYGATQNLRQRVEQLEQALQQLREESLRLIKEIQTCPETMGGHCIEVLCEELEPLIESCCAALEQKDSQ